MFTILYTVYSIFVYLNVHPNLIGFLNTLNPNTNTTMGLIIVLDIVLIMLQHDNDTEQTS